MNARTTRSTSAANSAANAPVSSRTRKPTSTRGSRPAANAKAASGNRGARSTPSLPPGVSPEMYKLVQEHLHAQKRAVKEAEDAAVRARNQELLDAEQGESETEADSRPRKRQRPATSTNVMSDDEIDIASGLYIRPQAPQVQAAAEEPIGEDKEDEEVSSASSERGDEEAHEDLDGIDIDEGDVEVDLGSGDADLSNEIITVRSSTDATPPQSTSRKSANKMPKAPTASNSSNTSKVVEKDFSPRTLKLALLAKSHVRTRTIYDDPFPRNNKISRINFSWTTIRESAASSDDADVRQAYGRATKDLNIKTKLMKFTLYGRTGLISSIISKARDKVRAYYGFSGDADTVKKDVEWLLTKSHFAYGGISLRDRTVDTMKPFGAQIIIDIIEAQWFPSTSRSKLDLETTNRIYEKKDLPLNVILIVVTAIEHALKEWSSTGRKACQITFSEDTARANYEKHLRHWNYFQSQMKAWPSWWRKTVLDQILANHTNLEFNEDDNDFAGLDFSGLDRLAGYEEDDTGETSSRSATAGREMSIVDGEQRNGDTSGHTQSVN